VFQADGFATKQDYQKAHGSDLYMTDTDKYDQICKARPAPAWRYPAKQSLMHLLGTHARRAGGYYDACEVSAPAAARRAAALHAQYWRRHVRSACVAACASCRGSRSAGATASYGALVGRARGAGLGRGGSGCARALGASRARGAAQVEPFSRALRELDVDCMVNGRRRDHGFDRAHLEARLAEPRAGYWWFCGAVPQAEEHADMSESLQWGWGVGAHAVAGKGGGRP